MPSYAKRSKLPFVNPPAALGITKLGRGGPPRTSLQNKAAYWTQEVSERNMVVFGSNVSFTSLTAQFELAA
jgi:hypothetical protein